MDKRRHPRFIKRLTATFVVDNQKSQGISSDLSESGLFIRTSRGLAVNTPIDIELLLPNNRICHLKGTVRRTIRTPISAIKNGMGIEITEKDETFIDFVKSFIGESETKRVEKGETLESQTISFSASDTLKKDPGNRTHERRRHKRLGVEHLKIDSEMPAAGDVRVLNISIRGILLKAESLLKIGRKYAVRLAYADRVLFAQADVVWSLLLESPEGAGVKPVYLTGMQFTSLSDKKIKEIVNIMEFDADAVAGRKKTEPAEFMEEVPAHH
jgi:hypothetical protein